VAIIPTLSWNRGFDTDTTREERRLLYHAARFLRRSSQRGMQTRTKLIGERHQALGTGMGQYGKRVV
jgi:hypothetical protein